VDRKSRQSAVFARHGKSHWAYHFGAGIVASPNDLEFNGGAPPHPELLDWLARRFIENGWSVKKLHEEILLSQTYQQSSAFKCRGCGQGH
jgi:hypothetical protein